MKNHALPIPIHGLFFLLFFITSCDGQVKTNTPNDSRNESGRPKMVRTQGSNQASSVSCGLQDKTGLLWFGTSGEGLYRYDPVKGEVINYLEKDGLCNNNILSILEDKSGNIWFGTSAGLCRYDPSASLNAGGKPFVSIPIAVTKERNLDPSTEKAPTNAQPDISSIMQDKTGKIWFGTGNDGVYCYDPAKGEFIHFLHNDGVINKSDLHLKAITAILEDRHGNIWFATWFEGLCRYDPAAGELSNFKPNGDVWFGAIFEDKSGSLWFGTRDHGAYRYDGKTFANFFADIPIFNACGVCAMTEDNAGNIWFATEFGNAAERENFGGVWRYNPSASLGGFIQMTNYTIKDGLRNNAVFSVTLDKTGKLWFGTRDMGLCSYDPSAAPSAGEKIFTDFSDRQSKDIRRIFEDQAGNLWFGTNGDGVCCYDPAAASRSDSKAFTYFTPKEGLGGTDVRCITADKNGTLWFGTNGGVSKFDGRHFTNFTVLEGLSSNDIWSLMIDKTGAIWVGTKEGACRYNPSTVPDGSKAFTSFSIPAAEQNDFSRPVSGTRLIWDIKEDRAGNIWFATNGAGAFRYDPASGGLSNVSKKDGLCNDYVNYILEDKKGKLWFATQHGGVSCYDPKALPEGSKSPSTVKAGFITFTPKEGVCGNSVWSMMEDKAGNIWFAANTLVYPATHSGRVCRYDGRTFTNFKDNEGLLTNNYVQSVFEDSKGVLWLGSVGGLCRFDPAQGEFINITKGWSLGVL